MNSLPPALDAPVPPPFSHDRGCKDLFNVPVSATSLINTLLAGTQEALGLSGPYRPDQIQTFSPEWLLRNPPAVADADTTRHADLLVLIRAPDTAQPLGAVHVEFQSSYDADMRHRFAQYSLLLDRYLEEQGAQLRTRSILVHTGLRPWPDPPPLLSQRDAAGWRTPGDPVALLDVGLLRTIPWELLPLHTETDAFVCMEVLRQHMADLWTARTALVRQPAWPLYRERLHHLCVRLAELAAARGWRAHGFESPVVEWIYRGILKPLDRDRVIHRHLAYANTLQELTMITDTLDEVVERHWARLEAAAQEKGMEQGMEQGIEQGIEQGKVIQLRRDLLAAAAPYLDPAARVHCEAALATRSLAQLPSVVDIMTLVLQTAYPAQAVERLLTGDMPSPRQDVDSQAGANGNDVA